MIASFNEFVLNFGRYYPLLVLRIIREKELRKNALLMRKILWPPPRKIDFQAIYLREKVFNIEIRRELEKAFPHTIAKKKTKFSEHVRTPQGFCGFTLQLCSSRIPFSQFKVLKTPYYNQISVETLEANITS